MVIWSSGKNCNTLQYNALVTKKYVKLCIKFLNINVHINVHIQVVQKM